MDDDATDSDDLDSSNVVKKEPGHDDSLRESSSLRRNTPKSNNVRDNTDDGSVSEGGETQNLTDDEQPLRGHPLRPGGVKISWSEDEDEVSGNVKPRKGANRERTTASVLKKKAASNKRNRGVIGDDGPRQKARKLDGAANGKAKKKERQWGDESDDDQLMEYTLPDYLQKRRSKFDARYQKMTDLGLRLPPRYDDVMFSDDENLEDLAERPLFPSGKPSASYKDKHLPKSLGIIPAAIAQWLRGYQVDGTAFLHTLFVYQIGGILGDDMGLGKTVQVIAFLTAAFGKTGDERDAKRMRKMRRAHAPWYPRALVVCPGTLIENWKDELQRWGWWHVDVYHGEAGAREAALQAAATGRVEILITTYATYRMNKGAINMVEWDCVIADECHQIKGRKSETTLAMNEVNALCRIGLTGTAIQNSYDELWTLLNWTNPGKFGPISTWKTSITEPLRQGQSHDATNYQLSKARKTAKALVQNLLPQFFLRRMKTLIADQLPKKSDRVVFCPLTDVQADAYENCIDGDTVRFIRESTDTCSCSSGKKAGWCCQMYLPDGSKWQSHVFPAISRLQKLSNHLAILIPQSNDPQDKQAKDLEALQVAVPHLWKDLYRTRDSILNYSNPEYCGKWKVLKKLLRFWHGNGDKVLVFSHSVRLLRMLQLLFQHTTYNVSYLDGSMSYADRAGVVADFNADPDQFVFLISTKAGGVGLNITSANKVVVVDPNWNPSYDLQAQDRAYRIGQVRDVEVFRLVSAGTIEEIVYARQIYKQQQANIGYTASTERRYFRGVQESAHQKGEIFGLANLFNYQHENLVLKDIVNKTNVAESKAGVAIAGVDFENDHSQPSNDSDGNGIAGNDKSATNHDSSSEETAMSQLAALIVDEANNNGDPQASKSSSTATTTKKIDRPKKPNTNPTTKRSDPIQAILSSAGVEYSHENSEVVGSSRVEAGLSRRAVEAGADTGMSDRHAFAGSSQIIPAASASRMHDDIDIDDKKENNDDNDTSNDNVNTKNKSTTTTIIRKGIPASHLANNNNNNSDTHMALKNEVQDSDDDNDNDIHFPSHAHPHPHQQPHSNTTSHNYRYHPPLEIRKRQLCTMASDLGFEDAVEFALVVEGWTAAGRRAALERFYAGRRAEQGRGSMGKRKQKKIEVEMGMRKADDDDDDADVKKKEVPSSTGLGIEHATDQDDDQDQDQWEL